MVGIAAIGWAWTEVASVVLSGEAAHLSQATAQRKLALARLWMAREMPMIAALGARALQGGAALMDLDADLV
jgi:hypothetical protein